LYVESVKVLKRITLVKGSIAYSLQPFNSSTNILPAAGHTHDHKTTVRSSHKVHNGHKGSQRYFLIGHWALGIERWALKAAKYRRTPKPGGLFRFTSDDLRGALSVL